MRAMRSSPAASRIERTTVVLPEPVPPATPRMQGLGPGIAASGSSSGAGSSTAWLAPRPGRRDGGRTPGFYRLRRVVGQFPREGGLGHFEIRFLYGPRFFGASAGSSPTISSTDHR